MWHLHTSLKPNQQIAVLILFGASLATTAAVLICILHCHLVLGDSHNPPAHVVVDGQHIMICHTPGDSSALVPVPLDFATLQSITNIVPVVLLLTGAVWLLLRWLLPPVCRSTPLVVYVPEPPPPRWACGLAEWASCIHCVRTASTVGAGGLAVNRT